MVRIDKAAGDRKRPTSVLGPPERAVDPGGPILTFAMGLEDWLIRHALGRERAEVGGDDGDPVGTVDLYAAQARILAHKRGHPQVDPAQGVRAGPPAF